MTSGSSSGKSPIALDMKNLYNDKSFMDIELRTSDGGTISAHKTILAARSPVLKAMLFNRPESLTNSELSIEFDTSIVQAIVDFCYADSILTQRFLPGEERNDVSEEQLKQLYDLLKAADHFGLKDLICYLNDAWASMVQREVSTAWKLLIIFSPESIDESVESQNKAAEKLYQTAKWLLATTNFSADDPMIPYNKIPKSLAKELVQSRIWIRTEEIEMFRFLQRWRAEAPFSQLERPSSPVPEPIFSANQVPCSPPLSPSSPSSVATRSPIPTGNRRQLSNVASPPSKRQRQNRENQADDTEEYARDLANKWICFEKIDPLDIINTVDPSGWVQQHTMLEIYKKQLIHATTIPQAPPIVGNDVSSSSSIAMRGPYWDKTDCDVLQSNQPFVQSWLTCFPIDHGVYTWSIRVDQSKGVLLGFGERRSSGDYKIAYHPSGTVFLEQDGSKRTIRSDLPHYTNGSIITFRCEISKQEKTFSLYASVKNASDHHSHQAQLEKCSLFKESEFPDEVLTSGKRDLVPFAAVGMGESGGVVNFLGFKQGQTVIE